MEDDSPVTNFEPANQQNISNLNNIAEKNLVNIIKY